MGIASDLSVIKEVSDTLTGNKVARFAYTQQAYDDNDADGVQAYNVNNEQNIPVASASIMKVNDTVIDKGWRARASSITRMLMNHFLGRLSYNVNKLTDMFDSLLTAINANLGVADGFATLNASGKVPDAQLNMGVANGLATINADGKVALLNNVVNTGDSAIPTSGGTNKFTTGGAYTLQQAVNGKAPINHASADTTYGQATTDSYGHVKISDKIMSIIVAIDNDPPSVNVSRYTLFVNSTEASTSLTVNNPYYADRKVIIWQSSPTGVSKMVVTISGYDDDSFTIPVGGFAVIFPVEENSGVLHFVY